jgi:LysM repeat protein
VQSGDTLSAIAARFETTTKALVDLNGISDPSRLKIGQVLRLP